MNLLAITRHGDLVERLRTAFEGEGHRVTRVEDPLKALAAEAWDEAQLILVDAAGDPLDGFHFGSLLRGESRVLFQNLPIFLIFEGLPATETLERLGDCGLDGFVEAGDGLHRLRNVLGPALQGQSERRGSLRLPLVAAGLRKPLLTKVRGMVSHFGFDLLPCPLGQLEPQLQAERAALCLIGLDPQGDRALKALEGLRERGVRAHPILLGTSRDENLERRLFLAGAMDWVPLPLSAPRLLHACRRGVEWLRARRIQAEFQLHIAGLKEQRIQLEIETSALRNEVLTDPLTGLLNRRAFNQNLDHALNQWERHGRPFVLLLSDLDFFKLINDRFGHLVGDQVLQATAHRMHANLRKSDLAFRIGGEEFAVLLPETQMEAGLEVAEKLRRRIDETPITLASGQTVFPTMSFGVGTPHGSSTGEGLFAQVDQALYRAKQLGRNRIEAAAD